MERLVGCSTASDLVMFIRTFLSHSFSGLFLHWALIRGNRGEALGGTGRLVRTSTTPCAGQRVRRGVRRCTQGYTEGVHSRAPPGTLFLNFSQKEQKASPWPPSLLDRTTSSVNQVNQFGHQPGQPARSTSSNQVNQVKSR